MKNLVVFLILGGFASAACAQSQDVAQSAQPGVVAVGTQASDARADDRNCLQQTGSHITAARNARNARTTHGDKSQLRCSNATGRSYTREDIDRTGATDLAQALRMLDPAIR